jgi:cytochrome c-type biogenesis protein CcmH
LGDWGFWIAAGGMTLAVAGSLIAVLFQRRDAVPAGAFDLQVYRAQLAEADRLRAEISRRILEADRLGRGVAVAVSPGGQAFVGMLIAIVLVGAVWGYLRLGAPGYPDLPLAGRLASAEAFRATRPSQAMAEAAAGTHASVEPDAQMADLMIKLRRAVAERPGDGAGLKLLVTNEAALGNLSAARDALAKLMALKSADVGQDHAQMAELLIRLAGGYVSPEAEAELIAALKREPTNGTALYYSGLMFAQGDRADRAFSVWQGLLENSGPDDPWVEPIRAQIADMAALAGVKYDAPEAVGPTADQVGAAADMTPEDRLAMIQGMVDGLSQRLATKGGPVEDWARLITSLGVLGDKDQAREIYTEGLTTFTGRAAELDVLRAAAVAAGVAE